MDNYINNYKYFKKTIVFDFNLNDGGIGDCIKFFIFILDSCIKNKERLYYIKNNIEIENYIKLKYDIMYIENNEKILKNYNIVKPQTYYSIINNEYRNDYGYCIDINDVFYFSKEVIINSQNIFPPYITDYISIHLRLGDKFLEIPEENIFCKNDVRDFSEEKINNIILKNKKKYIYFCCDNNSFRQKIKEKYNNIIITSGEIGHTSYLTTTNKQILDTITEFYLLTNSKRIFASSQSGFSIIAAKFNNIQYIKLYNISHNYIQ